MQVNVAATLLMSELLLPLLKRTATKPTKEGKVVQPRLTIVTSFVHFVVGEIPGLGEGRMLELANDEKRFEALGMTYNVTKGAFLT
jgi:hypothetical protein